MITLTNNDVIGANQFVVKEKGRDTKEEGEVVFKILMVNSSFRISPKLFFFYVLE